MSFSRIQYDTPEYQSKILQTTQPFNYSINVNQTNSSNSCNPDVTLNYPERYAYTSSDKNIYSQIEIDNYLSTRADKRSHKSLLTPEKSFQEESSRLLSNRVFEDDSCDNLTSNHTLLSNPKSYYRGLTTQHLVFLNLERDPQDTIPYQYAPFTISSRDAVKKTYQNHLCSREKKQVPPVSGLPQEQASSGCNKVNFC